MIDHITIGLPTDNPYQLFPGSEQSLLDGWLEHLQRLKIVDEILIVEMLDPGIEPRIPEKLLDPRCRVVRHPNDPPVERTRQEMQEMANNDWMLHLDDDERMSEGMIRFLESLATEDLKAPAGRTLVAGEDYAAIQFTREDYIYYNGVWRYIPANGNDPQIRLMDRRSVRWHGRPHEIPEIDGRLLSVQRPDTHILHYRSYEKIVRKTNKCNEQFKDQPNIVSMQDAYVERVKAMLGVMT